MSAEIREIKDGDDSTIIYPKTMTKAVYDEDGNRLDNVLSQVNESLTDSDSSVKFKFGIDSDGNYGYIKDGADSVTPFKTKHTETYTPTANSSASDMGESHSYRYVDTNTVYNLGYSASKAVLLATISGSTNKKSNTVTSINISAYSGATTANFLVVPTGSMTSTGGATGASTYPYAIFNPASVSISGTTLKVTSPTVQSGANSSANYGYLSVIACKVYYINI